jgi:hypothetical protein
MPAALHRITAQSRQRANQINREISSEIKTEKTRRKTKTPQSLDSAGFRHHFWRRRRDRDVRGKPMLGLTPNFSVGGHPYSHPHFVQPLIFPQYEKSGLYARSHHASQPHAAVWRNTLFAKRRDLAATKGALANARNKTART